MNRIVWAVCMAAIAKIANSGTLCSVNPYTASEAEEGRSAFNSHCALCHQYSMQGRVPGNYLNGFQLPKAYFQIAAYVLYRNCGKI